MAKGNLFLGTARGRVGSVVFRRRNGQQITSVRTAPTNPKSEAQCKQRMVFATSVSAAARLRTIVDHSFEGMKYGQDSVNYFTKLNTPMLRAGMNYDGETEMPDHNNYLIKGAKGLARMPFQISRGQLSFPKYRWATSFDEESPATNFGAELIGVQTEVLQGEISTATEYAAILGYLGLQPGEQLTLVAGLTDNNIDAEYTPTGAVNFATYVEFARIIFKPVADIDFTTPFRFVDARTGNFNSLVVNFEKSSNWVDKVIVEVSTAGNAVIVPATTGLDVVMVALIRSARGASGWLRSSAKFVLGDESDALAWQVWPSYGQQESEGTSRRYLNQPYNRADETPNDEIYAPVIDSFTVASPTATSITISNIQSGGFTTNPQFATVEVKNAAGDILVSKSYPYGEIITAETTAELVEGQTYDVKLTIQGVSKTQQFTKNA